MSLDKFKKPNIKKVIDPGFQDAPGKAPLVPQEIAEQREIPRESYITQVKDLIEEVSTTFDSLEETFQDIVTRNSSSVVFQNYKSLVDTIPRLKEITNIENLPPQQNKNSVIQLKIAERAVFRRVVDPRAPFLRELRNMENELATIKLTAENVWSQILQTNELYPEPSENNIVNQVLGREKQRIINIRQRNKTIKNTGVAVVSNAIAAAIARRIIEKIIQGNYFTDAPRWFKDTIRTLKQVRLLLTLKVLVESKEWETTSENLTKTFMDLKTLVLDSYERAKTYALFIGTQENIEDFLDDFLPEELNLALEDIPEFTAFRNRIEQMLFNNVKEVEEDLIIREGSSLSVDEARTVLVYTAQQSSSTKKDLTMLNSIIGYLEGIQTLIQSLAQLDQLTAESYIAELTKIIEEQSSALLRKVEW